jgi:hypothetical protein
MEGSTIAGYRNGADHARRNEKLNELINSGAITLSTGARACFNTNCLDITAIERLTTSIKKVFPKFEKPDRGNWDTVTILDDFDVSGANGNKVPFKDRIQLIVKTYAEVNPEEHYGSYSVGEITVDFDSLKMNKELAEKYGYGVVFVGDSNNRPDVANAHIKFVGKPKFRPLTRGYVRPYVDSTDRIQGVFKSSGSFVIYYPVNEIEKVEGKFYPVFMFTTISLFSYRNQNNEIIDTKIAGTFTEKKCVEDHIGELIHIFRKNSHAKYEYFDSFVEQFVGAFDVDPTQYLNFDHHSVGKTGNSHGGYRGGNRGADYVQDRNRAADEDQIQPDDESSGQDEGGSGDAEVDSEFPGPDGKD